MASDGAVLVTGAGGGMGRACASALVGLGDLLLQDLDTAALTETAAAFESAGIRTRSLAGDLCDSAHLEDVSGVDWLVDGGSTWQVLGPR